MVFALARIDYIINLYIHFTFHLNGITFDSSAIGQENFESESRTEEDILLVSH